MPPRGVTVHPSPQQEVMVDWRSPIQGPVRIAGLVADVDGNCGNGIAWRIELINRAGATALASGTLNN